MTKENLEGKYFVFDFYSDDVTECLALFQFNKGSLEEKLEIAQNVFPEMIEYLSKRNVSEIYSLNSNDDREKLFGLQLFFYEHDDFYYHYDGIYNESNWCGEFKENGIELKEYNLENER